ncbi:MAG: PEP-CTERM/exosortase system-associated acyltransferase [Methylovulum sp.]|nr:PEP-CTERM/exosortase system-associated acyltransferase [Methylovulum sp.]
MNSNTVNLFDLFNDYFEKVPATSDALKKEVYKLRYQVYCLEIAGYKPEDYPDGLESDEYDSHSIHYLIRHRKSGEYAATTRIILTDANNPDELLPIETHCTIDNVAVTQTIDRRHLAEVSRFCVSKSFKKRKNEANTLTPICADLDQDFFTADERRTFPHITFALIASVIKASREHNIDTLYGSMELPWLRFLAASGINFVKIGPLVNYHGERWPCAIKIDDLLNDVEKKNKCLWEMLTNKGRF